ncbi:MAG: hypothetical protein QME66_13440 [Candidatus Eisenbacteria bacterium]|nr:hypothetical protein [Candidatus Eisenbacteria bacterium]
MTTPPTPPLTEAEIQEALNHSERSDAWARKVLARALCDTREKLEAEQQKLVRVEYARRFAEAQIEALTKEYSDARVEEQKEVENWKQSFEHKQAAEQQRIARRQHARFFRPGAQVMIDPPMPLTETEIDNAFTWADGKGPPIDSCVTDEYFSMLKILARALRDTRQKLDQIEAEELEIAKTNCTTGCAACGALVNANTPIQTLKNAHRSWCPWLRAEAAESEVRKLRAKLEKENETNQS